MNREIERCDSELRRILSELMSDPCFDMEGLLQGYQYWCHERKLISALEYVRSKCA
jgi:hypothetical protein